MLAYEANTSIASTTDAQIIASAKTAYKPLMVLDITEMYNNTF